LAEDIGRYKKRNNIAILQTARWNEILEKAYQQGRERGLNYPFVEKFLTAVHQESIAHQTKIMQEENNPNQIQIELSEEMAEGIYSNLAIITHSTSEFVFDFIRVMPGVPKAKVKARIVLTPEHAKRLLLALSDNINKYEDMNGEITVLDNMPAMPLNFGGTTGQA
jgi:hypothetical protein